MDWDGGWIGKVPGVWIGFVVSCCSNQLRTSSWNVEPCLLRKAKG
jgi:hypothetical protein